LESQLRQRPSTYPSPKLPTDSKAINIAVFSEAVIQQVLAGKKAAPYRICAEPREFSLR